MFPGSFADAGIHSPPFSFLDLLAFKRTRTHSRPALLHRGGGECVPVTRLSSGASVWGEWGRVLDFFIITQIPSVVSLVVCLGHGRWL